MTNQIKEPNILKCALKKASITAGRHLKYFATAIVVIALLYGGYTIVTSLYSITIVPAWALLASIPWYWYPVVAVPLAYVGYGALWCVARDLAEEDWKSAGAENAFVLFALFTLFALFALAPTLAPTFVALALALPPTFVALALFALALALFALAFIVLTEGSNYGKPTYFAIRFIGAYLHYRKRMRNVTLQSGGGE